MNKSNGNMYEWVSHTWNPLAGKCPHNCSYCSTNKLAKRYKAIAVKYSGEPRLDDNAMKDNLGNGNTIFVCAQNDLFAKQIPHAIIIKIISKCLDHKDNTYLFQTKNPGRVIDYFHYLPASSILCTTIESNRVYADYMGETPIPVKRATAMNKIALPKYVTIEPIMDFDLHNLIGLIQHCNPIQVNVGADSGHNNLPEPSQDKIHHLVTELQKFTKVKLKDNLKRLYKP